MKAKAFISTIMTQQMRHAEGNMRHIILIGFMGAGKSAVGRRLARKMEVTFLDTDHLIEEQTGRKISEIFAEQGEPYFRTLETESLRELSKRADRCVISVGGGLPMRPENHALLRELGTIVFLEAKVETLLARLANDTKRPILQGGDKRRKIEQLMEQRKETYEKLADVRITTDRRGFSEILEEIIEKVEGNS